MTTSILHVVATLDRGGTEVTALALAREFARRGYVNRVVALDTGSRSILDDLTEVVGQPIELPSGRFARARAMRHVISETRPDAVLFHIFNIELALLAIAARIGGVTNIVAVIGNPVAVRRGMATKIRIIVRLIDYVGVRVVSASRWIHQSLVDAGRAPRDSVVIHNGCDVEAIANLADASRLGRQRGAIVGMVSRLDPIKDHATLLKAFARLPKEINGKETRLQIVGEGPMRASIEALAVELDIMDRTIFLGLRRDIPQVIANFDVFAFSTTRDEGFGVVLIEALSAGTPIIATDVPACREVLEGGVLGRLVPEGSIAQLADALRELLANPPNIPPRGEIEKRYGINSMANAYLYKLLPRAVKQ